MSQTRIRKRSDESESESKKYKFSTDPTETLSTSIKDMPTTSAQIPDMDLVVQNAIAKAFENPTIISKLTAEFAIQCTGLIQSAMEKTDEKIGAVEQIVTDNQKRIDKLETMADDFEQQQRANNLVVRGIVETDQPKRVITSVIAKKTGIEVTENDLKFAVKLTTKSEKPDQLAAYKICFLDRKHRDAVYMRRMLFKGTKTYLSEDLTLKRSSLAYKTREHVRSNKGSSTWTMDGKIFFKKGPDDKPRLINIISDLENNEEPKDQ